MPANHSPLLRLTFGGSNDRGRDPNVMFDRQGIIRERLPFKGILIQP